MVEATGSTNADVAEAARAGAREGLVVVAEAQSAGRGRLGRDWVAAPRSALLLSVLLRPAQRLRSAGLLPLLAGVAVAEAVRSVGGLPARLKWPNDVLIGGRKVAGILVERHGGGADPAYVVGIGLNVSARAGELPHDAATSIAIEGGRADREPLLKEVLRALARRYRAFATSDDAPGVVLPAYRAWCETIGRPVQVNLPGGGCMSGIAQDVDDQGRLLVIGQDETARVLSAGDVVHVRAEG